MIISPLKKEIDSLSAEFEVLKLAKKTRSESESKPAKKTKKKDASSKKASNVISSKDEKRSKSKSRTKETPFDAEVMFKDMID